MQGVQVAPAINDENRSQLHGPALFKENASNMQAAKQGSALKTGRKAFGNITNAQPRDAAQPGTVKRRAFGDITNSTLKPSNTAAKKGDATQLKPSSSKAAAAVAAEPAAVPVMPWWETAEPERPAGKTWDQLLADREREEEADIERSVQQLLSGFRSLTSRCLQVQPDESSEEEEALLVPAMPSSLSSLSAPTAAPTSTTATVQQPILSSFSFVNSSSEEYLADLLPDVQLPWLDQEEPVPTAAAAAGTAAAAVAEDAHQPRAVEVAKDTSGSSIEQHAPHVFESPSEQTSSPAKHMWPGAGDGGDGRCSSPSRPEPMCDGGSAGLKSPEALPW